MVKVTKRLGKKGVFYYVDYSKGGQRKRKSFGRNKKVADLFSKNVEVQLAKDASGLFVKSLSIESFLSKSYEYIKINHRPRTSTRYAVVLLHFKDFIKTTHVVNLSQVTPAVMEQYKNFRVGKVTNGTINKELKMLKSFFNKARQWGYMVNNPILKGSNLPEMGRRLPRFYSKEEANAILKASHQPYRDIFTVLLYTGMRRDELRFLNVEQVDFKNNRIEVKETPLFRPKTAQERTIPLHEDIIPILRRHCGRSGLLFPTKSGKPYHESYWWKTLKKIAKRIGVKDVNIHAFRHTFASWLVMRGIDLRTVGQLLGHADFKTTLIYAHLADKHIQDSIKSFPSLGTNQAHNKNKRRKPS